MYIKGLAPYFKNLPVRNIAEQNCDRCRAASTRIFLNYFEETRLPDILEKLGARLTIACPVNHELDSIYQIQKLVNAIGGKVDFVIIRNRMVIRQQDSDSLHKPSSVFSASFIGDFPRAALPGRIWAMMVVP
jgi:hypothetical protein